MLCFTKMEGNVNPFRSRTSSWYSRWFLDTSLHVIWQWAMFCCHGYIWSCHKVGSCPAVSVVCRVKFLLSLWNEVVYSYLIYPIPFQIHLLYQPGQISDLYNMLCGITSACVQLISSADANPLLNAISLMKIKDMWYFLLNSDDCKLWTMKYAMALGEPSHLMWQIPCFYSHRNHFLINAVRWKHGWWTLR